VIPTEVAQQLPILMAQELATSWRYRSAVFSWPLYRAFGTYQLTTKGFGIETKHIKDTILKYVDEGKIELSEQFLGVSEDWDTFDGRTAVRGD
jgi:hypothetical protein